MRGEVVLEEQLLGLPPFGRCIAGLILLAGGVGAAVAFWQQGLIWYGSWFCVLFGLACAASGLRDLRQQRRIDAEVVRARGEWADLARDLAHCKRTGGNSARMLQERGYREFAVRRWIVRELEGDRHARG